MSHDTVIFITVLITAFVATFISSRSGGGSAMITIPIYLWLGIPFPMATAIHKTSSCFWVVLASRNYLKEKTVDKKFLFAYAGIGLVGAIIGALLVSKINTQFLKPIIGTLIIGLVLWMFTRKGLGTNEARVEITRKNKILMYLSAPLIGFYESFFGSGNGIFFSNLNMKLRGGDLIEALGTYYFAAFFWLVVTVIILLHAGQYNLPLMISATIGGTLGGYFGSKFGMYKGNKFIKWAFIIVGTILGLKLIIGF